MDIVDLISNFTIGIASGIVSSIIVTIIYRNIDTERNRQIYFTSIKTYYMEFSHYFHKGPEELYDFLQCNAPPKPYKWLRFNSNEHTVIHWFLHQCAQLKIRMMLSRGLLLRKEISDEDYTLKCQQIANDTKKEILSIRDDIFSLGDNGSR